MVFTSSVELTFRRDAILKAQLSKAEYLLCLAWCLQAESSWHFEGMPFWRLSRAKHGIYCVQPRKAWYYNLSRAGISEGCDSEGSVKQSMVFIVFSMVFTTAVELAFRRQSMLKAQSTKAWYLLCLAWCSQAHSSWLFEVTAILKAQATHGIYCV